jgi:hypothetical protein
MTEGASTNWVKPRLKVPRPARSVDRTRSPAAVSQKREYFGIWPETFGNFAPPLAKSGGWRPLAESEKPAVGGISPTIRDGFPEGRTAWLTWEDSNFHIPISKNAFEMSTEFPLFWPKIRLGDFCSCKLWN